MDECMSEDTLVDVDELITEYRQDAGYYPSAEWLSNECSITIKEAVDLLSMYQHG